MTTSPSPPVSWLRRSLIGLVGVGIAIQLVPYGREHSNPPVGAEPAWDQATTRALAVRACFDCHSNETRWPWYSKVAPISWIVASHVEEGRSKLNFSDWRRPGQHLDQIIGELRTGEMPLWDYLIQHPEARLSATEKAALLEGLEATLAVRAR